MASKKLIIKALQKELKRIAFDANLYDKGIADHAYAEQCSKKRKEILAAIEELKQPQQTSFL